MRYTVYMNSEYLVIVFLYQVYQARLRERLLTSRGLPSDSTCVLQAKPGKLDIKRRALGILFTRWFTLHTSDYGVISEFRVNAMSLTTSFKSATS